jgi:ABC-type nitrate/sulfonate/bicarbonate transport system substrate-binding protein
VIYSAARCSNHSYWRRTDVARCAGKSQDRCGIDGSSGPRDRNQSRVAMMFIENTTGEDPSISEFLMENLIARPETLKKDPDLVRKMVRALFKANQWALNNTPEQVAEALRPTFAKTDPAIHLAGVRAVLATLSKDGRTTERSVQATQDVLEQAGLLKKRVAYGDLVSNEFLPK